MKLEEFLRANGRSYELRVIENSQDKLRVEVQTLAFDGDGSTQEFTVIDNEMNEEEFRELDQPMRTAKDIAFKAFCHFMPDGTDFPMKESETRARFENWWRGWYHRGDHRGCFEPEHDIFVEGQRYIRAE